MKPFGSHKRRWLCCSKQQDKTSAFSIYKEGELIRAATVKEYLTVQKEGELIEGVVVKDSLTTTQHRALPEKTQKRKVKLYNLDVIISVGYRVKSQKAPQIRNE